jgi:hypothetical protein
MSFGPDHRTVPESLRTDEFLVRPLRETDAELDYEAVMESRIHLRRSSLSSWPSDDFTIDQNRQDLAQHEKEHTERTAFTYTVMNPDEAVCLGCVYVTPLPAHLLQVGAPDDLVEAAAWEEAVAYFWVRASRLAGGLEGRLFRALRGWFEHNWAFQRVLYLTHTEDPRQVNLFREAGLEARIATKGTHGPVNFLYFG